MRAADVVEGALPGGLPCLAVGVGPPLVALPGLGGHNRNPVGAERRAQLSGLGALAQTFTVHLVQRRPGLAPGTTMADLADDVATAVRASFPGPVPVIGTSTGGSVALQLAVDQPDLVSRLVLACAAARLSDEGRRRQRRLAELTLAGRTRAAWAQLGPALAGTLPTRAAMGALLWVMSGPEGPDAGDMIATIEAEDRFDLSGRLSEVRAPTLVVGSARDGYYSEELFAMTARGIRDGHLLLYPRSSHMSVLAHRSAQRAITHFLAGEEGS
jgi:pimeloyl-ACP methyl ester carboxylesterase